MHKPMPIALDVDDLLPTERAGIIVQWLQDNEEIEYTTAELAEMVGLTHHSMWEHLCKLSRVTRVRQSLTGWSMAKRARY